MKQFTYLLLLLSPFFAFTQKRLDLVHENAFAFYDYQEKVFCALDDSTFIWKYNGMKEKWEKSPIELHLEMPFVKFLTDFIPMSDKGSPVYFVYKGCGVVYMKNGNAIRRHDHSFYHMNQYSGTYFIDEGEPRIYGGYGMFTNKNIITRYDTTEREWFVINSGLKTPPEGIQGVIKKCNNHYYIFDGFRGIGRNYFNQDRVWSFNLKTSKWRNIGKLNPKIKEKQVGNFYEEFQSIGNGYSCFENDIISYDFDKLRYKKYKFNAAGLYKNIIRVDSLFLIMKTTSRPSRFLVVSDSSFIKQFDCEEGEIILNETNSLFSVLIIIFSSITLLVLFFLFQLQKRKKQLFSRKNKNENSVLIEAEEFNQTEVEFLKLLIFHQENGLEISYINDLVNHDQPSIDTLKKRREILLKELRYKLAAKFNIQQEDVFIERRMENDKRMKLLFLNELVRIKM
jgi:hypothetical protein